MSGPLGKNGRGLAKPQNTIKKIVWEGGEGYPAESTKGKVESTD